MTKYAVQGIQPNDLSTNVIEVPDDVIIAGALYHPQTGMLTVVALRRIEEKKQEQPAKEFKLEGPPDVK